MSAELIARIEGRAGRITLNRPQALNAVTYDMVLGIERALDAWAADDAVALVLIDAAGDRAFAAGGDIKDLYERGRAGDFAFGRRFWADEYRMNAKIARFPKPVVTIVDGIVMGGGVGVSAHASHRIVSDGTMLAMPECGIGLIPDVGGSWLLARAPGRLGEYMGLTGARVGATDAILTGFADAYVPRLRLLEMIARLSSEGDPAEIDAFVETPGPSTLGPLREEIDAAFGAATAPEIVAALPAEGWGAEAAKALSRGCPLSVACGLEAIRAARGMDRLEDALALEYRFSARCTEHGEFLEGIRAAVIDKDRRPAWATPRLEDVTPERVAFMLSDLGEAELSL